MHQICIKWYQNVFSSVSGITWISTLDSIDGEVPSHAAEGAVGEPHVPIPRHPQPCVIPLLHDGADLPTNRTPLSLGHSTTLS